MPPKEPFYMRLPSYQTHLNKVKHQKNHDQVSVGICFGVEFSWTSVLFRSPLQYNPVNEAQNGKQKKNGKINGTSAMRDSIANLIGVSAVQNPPQKTRGFLG